jgi:hypothetical protein
LGGAPLPVLGARTTAVKKGDESLDASYYQNLQKQKTIKENYDIKNNLTLKKLSGYRTYVKGLRCELVRE